MNRKNLAIAVMTTAFTATMVSAHLPSETIARQQMGPVYGGQQSRAAALTVSDAKPFSSFAGGADAIVSHGEFEGQKLYWKNAWWAEKTDIPGEFADSGGTSPWGLINSAAFGAGAEYVWTGWNSGADKWSMAKTPGTHDIVETKTGDWGSQIDSKGAGAYVPTWRDGAEGAYSMIHDDIGAMSIDGSVMPANEVGEDHPRIRVGWGMKVDVMDATEWSVARNMVLDGHEILNHSWDHSSAAEQWQWHYPGAILSIEDPALPKEIRGLEVSASGTFSPMTVRIPYIDYVGGDAYSPDTQYQEVTFQVSSDYAFDSVELDHGDWSEWLYSSTGKIKAEHKGWSDEEAKNVDMLKVFAVPGWADTKTRSDVNIKVAKEEIDKQLYSQVESPRFPEGKETEYYVYPYDAYSNKTHDLCLADGHVASRGGAKSGMPIPGDFFQPFRIDFDAFFMLDAEASQVFPENPHQRLGLKALVERVVKTKGYMIREFHATADVNAWNDANDQALGGWWGGIPKSLYETHFSYLDGLIDDHKVVVYTPTEAVKYRLTANSVTAASLSGMNLSVTASGCGPQYQDEISVIVKFDSPVNALSVTYADGSFPRYNPVSMDNGAGKAWSVSVNPYVDGGSFTLDEVKRDEPVAPTYEILDGSGTAVLGGNTAKSASASQVSFAGIQNGQVALNLPAGQFKASLYSVNGRKIATTNVTSTAGMVSTNLSTTNLGAGMFILNVEQAGVSVMQHKLIAK